MTFMEKNSITLSFINCWNKIQLKFSSQLLRTNSPTKIKSLLTKRSKDKCY